MLRENDPFATHQVFLQHYISKTTGDIIEFGCGHGSTPLILDTIKGTNRKLVSLENDLEWYTKMLTLYPENDQHTYIHVSDWEQEINKIKEKYSIVFIDQSPWEARKLTMDYFNKHKLGEYIIIHDTDYFPVNGLFGKVISEFEFDFSDCFKKFQVYYPPVLPWPASTGPPTLVGTNCHDLEVDPTF